MKSYSVNLRERLVAGRQRGQSAEELSRLFGVSKRSVERYWKRLTQERTVEAKARGGYRRSKLEEHDERLRQWIGEEPDLTLGELRSRLLAQLAISFGATALWHRLEKLGLTFTKTLHAGEQNRPDLQEARERWRAQQAWRAGHHFVLLNETGLNFKVTRVYGRARRGEC